MRMIDAKRAAAPYRAGRALVMMGCSDEEIAAAFSMDLAGLALWAWNDERFYNAITPTDAEREEWRAGIQADRDKRNAARRRFNASNPSARVRIAMSARMWAALKGVRRDSGLFSRLPYSLDELRAHLTALFKQGMTWENYGQWHVDHIRPCASFDLKDPEQFAECWSLANLQPLWASENMRKGARLVS